MVDKRLTKMRKVSSALVSSVMAGLLVWIVISLWSSASVPAQSSSNAKRVVVLYWYDKDYPWNVMFDQSFQAALRSTGSAPVEYYAEYLETNRFPGEKLSQLLHDYLRQKYSDRKIDAVVATSDVSLDFLLKYRNDLFPTAPIVFVATKRPTPDSLTRDPGMTGFISINAYKKTLDLALRLHPDTEQVFIISGTLEHDKRIESLARAELQGFESRLRINYVTDVLPDELIAEMKDLPKHSLILYVWQQSQSPGGRVIESMETLGSIAQSAKVPIYRLSTTSYVGGGVVGGYINTAEANGTKVAEIVRQIVSGTAARDIPIEDAPTVPEFDWRQLQQLGISERQLPAGSIIRFKEVTFWGQYKGRIVTVLAIIALQFILIASLLFERNRKKRATRKLTESEQRFAKAFKANPQPMSLTTLYEGRFLDVNDSFLRMSGYARAEVVGYTSNELGIYENPEVRAKLLVEPLLLSQDVRDFEFKFRTKSGAFRTLLSSAELLELGREKCILLASADITERKQSERSLAELTGRLLRTQDEERRNIARELHDVTAQNIGVIMLNLAQLEKGTFAADKQTKEKLSESLTLGEQSLKDIRTLSYVLHPPLLDQAGLVIALQWLAKGFSERSGIKVHFSESGNVDQRMPPEVEYAFYRVVQECLTNIRRHTNSETAEIKLTRACHEVCLSVRDQGKGHKLNVPPNGNDVETVGVGIPGMRYRLNQLGGELLVDSDLNGTTVTATVPVKQVIYDSTTVS